MSPLLSLTDDDRKAHKELLRFAVGRRVQLSEEPLPAQDDSHGRWERFNKSLRTVPSQFIPGQILNAVDSLSKRPGQKHVRAAYEFLCEYCHPNSASRTLDFNLSKSDLGKHNLQERYIEGLSSGFLNVYAYCQSVIPPCCSSIDRSLSTLSRCRRKVPSEPLGLSEPPVGGRYIVDDFGRVGWVHSAAIHHSHFQRGVPLTEDQRLRVSQIHGVFEGLEVDPRTFQPLTLERSLELFSYEGPNVEEEIALWEHFVKVFERELLERGSSSFGLKHNLLLAMKLCYGVPTLGNALSANPQLKVIPQLQRLFDRVNDRHST